jgi:predicted lipid-binding transport protein (Tim44 family)
LGFAAAFGGLCAGLAAGLAAALGLATFSIFFFGAAFLALSVFFVFSIVSLF